MRTIETTIYTFDELSDKSKERAITAHRNPTPAEIRFGYGSTHYKDFPHELWTKPDGTIKHWTVCPHDGLRYYRSTH